MLQSKTEAYEDYTHLKHHHRLRPYSETQPKNHVSDKSKTFCFATSLSIKDKNAKFWICIAFLNHVHYHIEISTSFMQWEELVSLA